MSDLFRRVRTKKYGNYEYWRAEIWNPETQQFDEHQNLFPKRHPWAKAPHEAPLDEQKAWNRVAGGRAPTRNQAVLRARRLADQAQRDANTIDLTLERLMELEQQPMGKRRNRSQRTLNDIVRVTNRFVEFVKSSYPRVWLARDVRPAHIDSYLRERASKEASEATRTKELAYIRHAFGRAVDLDEIDKNPCSKIRLRLPNAKERMERTRGYSRSEIEIAALLAACRDKYDDGQGAEQLPPSYLFAFVLCAIQSGCRFGEMFETIEKKPDGMKTVLPGLLWRDIDWNGSRMFVTGKTKGRWVAMTPDLEAALLELRDKHEALDVLGDQVFQSDVGEPIRYPRTAFKSACARAKLKGDVRIHDLRHSCFTNLAARGVSPAAIQLLAGHSSPAMTAQYVHLAEDQMVGEVLDKAPAFGLGSKPGSNFDPDSESREDENEQSSAS